MKLQIQGIKSGQTIQLLDIVNIPDGTVFLEIETDKPKDKSARLARLNRIFGAWRNQQDIIVTGKQKPDRKSTRLNSSHRL